MLMHSSTFTWQLSFFLVIEELFTLHQMMKILNEPALSPNSGLENAFLSDQCMASNSRKRHANINVTPATG